MASTEQTTPINKGNYSLETEEREAAFEKNRGYGWEKEYKEYRRKWRANAENRVVEEYPILVDIELSTVCNLNCEMCYTISDEFKTKVGRKFMDMNLFRKIINEIGGKVPAVRLSLRGEPTLHPNFIDCIRSAKDSGIGEVSFLTNASTLDEDYFRRIADAGADWITVSIDGVGSEYERIRKPLKFTDTYNKLKRISEIKRENGWKRPVIKVQSIWPAISKDPQSYYDKFSEIVDCVAFNPLITFFIDNDQSNSIDNFVCPQLYQRLVISVDGNCLLCGNDERGETIVGNVWKDSIHDIWHGDILNHVRELHLNGKYRECSACKVCYLPKKTDSTEKIKVNGRELTIENYLS